ncbi:MAG: phage tail protein [Tepidiformaceae bacterium]
MPDQNVLFRFSVEISGIQEALFTECSGFEAKVEVEEYKEGGLNDYVHKLPGRQSYANITLKRGMTNSVELWDWLNRLATKSAKRDEKKDISVVLRDGKGDEILRWNLTKAYPVKWTSPTMQTDQSSIMVETLELAFQEVTMQRR